MPYGRLYDIIYTYIYSYKNTKHGQAWKGMVSYNVYQRNLSGNAKIDISVFDIVYYFCHIAELSMKRLSQIYHDISICYFKQTRKYLYEELEKYGYGCYYFRY